jgi:hypothetical protein
VAKSISMKKYWSTQQRRSRGNVALQVLSATSMVLFSIGGYPLLAVAANSPSKNAFYVRCIAEMAYKSGPNQGSQAQLSSKVLADPVPEDVPESKMKTLAAQFESWLDKHSPNREWFSQNLAWKDTVCGGYTLADATDAYKLAAPATVDWPDKGSGIRTLAIEVPANFYWICYGGTIGKPGRRYATAVFDTPSNVKESDIRAHFDSWIGAQTPGETLAQSTCFGHYKRELVVKTAAAYAPGGAIESFQRADFDYNNFKLGGSNSK